MFGGAMDPELFKLAQEQMSRMSPAELARIQQQMFSNPDLIRMASESMRNMKPEDMRVAAEQLKNTRPEDMAEIGEMMANASPGEIASMRARVDAQMTYEINAAQMLKNQGNELHNQGRYEEASQKYELACKNLKGIHTSKAKQLSKTCSLNLMSCYLKTRKFEECLEEGSKVLTDEAKNVKALYRRGQAYKELGKLEKAVSDLKNALEASPDDETIALVLREVEAGLSREDARNRSKGVVIEEITEELEESTSEVCKEDSNSNTRSEQRIVNESNADHNLNNEFSIHSERLRSLCSDTEDMRSFQSYIANSNPETLAGLSSENVKEISPDMFKTATNMIGQMSPETFQSVLRMTSEYHDGIRTGNSTTGSPPVTSDMLKNVSDMMGRMSPDELQKIFEMASSFRGSNSARSETSANTGNDQNVDRETRSSDIFPSTSNPSSLPSFPNSSVDMQERMMNQMKDPATRQMFASMMKNISPETLSNMSEQFGMKLSREEAAKAQQAMSSLSPEALEKMMVWSDRIHRGVERARSAKNWLLGKQGMILAICILLLAVVAHMWLSP